jgi:RNA polymerase sigma-70 factor (ECF subfamily)
VLYRDMSAIMTPTDPDVVLVERIATGDDRALGLLYDRHGRTAFGLAFRVLRDRTLAEDAVQEAFLAAWRSAERYDGRASVAAWLLTFVHRRAVDLVRREETRRRTLAESATFLVEDVRDPVDVDVELADESRAVHRALAQLTPVQREVVGLAYYGGLSQSEIAERLGVPLGTVKSRTAVALERLRELLEAEGSTFGDSANLRG